ncbi:MAG: protein kinase [Thermoanaerobaculia bacterium]
MRFGPYEILAPIGSGGMGEVYRARDTRLGRIVALKVLPTGTMPDSDARQRFTREARTVSALNEPHIVTIYDVGFDDQRDFIAMELIEGQTVRDLLAAGQLEIRRALEIVAQAAAGLAAAHEAGVIHRDIKPENLMVNRASLVKILDFGLAKIDEKTRASLLSSGDLTAAAGSGEQARTANGTILGTVSYMSPEQAAGRPLDNRTDIFSLGLVLYELLTGRRAFSGDSVIETLHAIIHDEPRPALDANPRLPRAAVDVLEKAIAKDPSDRYRHAGDLELDLRRIRRAIDSGVSTRVLAPAGETRGRRALPWIAAAFLMLAAGFAGWRLGSSRPRPRESTPFAGGSLTPLTTDPGYEGEPTFSPDGQTIAYVADREGNFEIYLQQISGGPALNLTRNPAADIQPAFSPDGREIAFVSSRASASAMMQASPDLPIVGGDIWVMPALGGTPRKIVENGNFPTWTPDGSGLLYVHGTFRNTRIARVSSRGGESRDVPIQEPSVDRYFYPSLSADGRWLLYQNGGRIEVVSADGGKPRDLAVGQSPAWGPASTTVLFTNGTPGKGRSLWRAPFSLARGEFEGAPGPVTFGRGADVDARASSDGSTIVFSAVDESLNLEALPFDARAGRRGPRRS